MTHTAGTAGAGYRVTEADHPYRERAADWGERPVCACGRSRAEHRAAS